MAWLKAATVPADIDVWQAGAMRAQTIPARIRWAVDLMDVGPADNILEIGCGPGAAAELICQRLQTGKLFAIDRSESGVDRTKRRCRKYVEAGRLTVRQIDLATLRVPVRRLHKVFAFNVNLFWVRACADEVALLHERVLPGGAVYLFYDASRSDMVPNIVQKASAALTAGGFRVSVVDQKAPSVVGIIGKR
jgi:trans-aconitate methyltransferase